MKKSKHLNLAVAALFAALTAALTAVHLPLPSESGYVHFGDAMICLSAMLLPAPYAMAASALGGAMADVLFGYFNWAPFTFLIKAANVIPFIVYKKYAKKKKLVTAGSAAASACSGVVTIVLYFGAGWLLYSMAGALADLPGSAIQAAGSSVIFLLIGSVLDKTKFDFGG